MTSTDVYISIIIGLLGVAYPVLLQVVARLDEKYSSDNIVEHFDTEWENKAFRYTLILSLVFIVIWSLRLPRVIDLGDSLNHLIEHSASLIISISSILLIVSFFFFVNKILIYYTPSRFIPYLIQRFEKSESDLLYFGELAELLYLFIREQQTNYSKTLSDFFYGAFRRVRDKHKGEPVTYPDLYYEVVYKAIEELAILKEKRNYLLEYRTSGEIWLLGELPGKEISETTYSWMWKNLLLAVRYEQDDLLVNHWVTCHQYYIYNLPPIGEESDLLASNIQVSNLQTVDKRQSERQRFIEFHFALGGLLMYKERYNCIKRLFNYTQQDPPRYELLPTSMDEIFRFYFDLRDPQERKFSWISSQYPFPELSGLNADHVIKKWMMSYMAILFLRQYTLTPFLTTIRPLHFPATPNTQSEKRLWIDGIDFFRKLVSEHLQDNILLKILNFHFLTAEWCEENQMAYPITFLETFKSRLEHAYHENASNGPISDEKVWEFENSTKAIIEETIDSLQSINNIERIQDDESDKWYVTGQRMLQSKDAFSEIPEVDYLHSFLASRITDNLKEVFSKTFVYKTTQSFLLKSEDFFKAIDRLELDDSFVIVNIGVDLNYYTDNMNIDDLSVQRYKNIDIYSFSGSRIVDNSLFIIRRSDLPNISTVPIREDIIEKYSLKKISDSIDLHSSVIDLNDASEEIYNENKQHKSDDELSRSVLLSVIISTEFKWKKNIEVIQLKLFSEYLQQGIPNDLDDVEPLKM